MVSPNVDDLSASFESIIDDRDIVGAATVALAGAGGGVLAQQIANVTLPRLGISERPSGSTGLFASGILKLAAAALHGFLAVRVGGQPGLILGVAAVGAAVVAGGDLISGILELGGQGGSAQQVRQNLSRGQTSGRVVRRSTSRSTSSSSNTSANGSSPDAATAASSYV